MNITDFISAGRQFAPEFLMSCCIINGSVLRLDEVQSMGCTEFGLRSRLNMPLKLYRYYPNRWSKNEEEQDVNYSHIALKNNTVFLQSPTEFDDVYDSDITIDFVEYEKQRLIEYCRRCQLTAEKDWTIQELGDALTKALWQGYNKTGCLNGAFSLPAASELELLSNQLFSNRVLVEFQKTNDFGVSVSNAIRNEYVEYCNYLKTIFRTTCFATTPYSQLMWGGAYGDCHKGFCVEYTVLPNEPKYAEVYSNLFPMVYCKVRPDMTERIVAAKDRMITEETLWDLYFHGALRKSIDWAFQNEWRLLLPLRKSSSEDYNVPFFPITKVYLGNRMQPRQRKEIIDICKEREIPYVGVKRNPVLFEMQDCEVLCEECPRFRGDTLLRQSKESG